MRSFLFHKKGGKGVRRPRLRPRSIKILFILSSRQIRVPNPPRNTILPLHLQKNMIKKRLVCLGDSLTEGYGIDLKYRWTDLLGKEMPTLEIIIQGISGDTTTGMLSRFQTDVLESKPSHLIIMGGTNDLWFGLSNSLILSNLHSMLRQARRAGIQTIIGIPTLVLWENVLDDSQPNLFATPGELSGRLVAYRDVVQRYAVDQELPSIDFSKDLLPNHFLEDGVHPNEAGNGVMMQNAAAVLRLLF